MHERHHCSDISESFPMQAASHDKPTKPRPDCLLTTKSFLQSNTRCIAVSRRGRMSSVSRKRALNAETIDYQPKQQP